VLKPRLRQSGKRRVAIAVVVTAVVILAPLGVYLYLRPVRPGPPPDTCDLLPSERLSITLNGTIVATGESERSKGQVFNAQAVHGQWEAMANCP